MTKISPTRPTTSGTKTVGTKSPSPIRDWHAEHKSHLTRGERAADIMRNGMGSWGFVGSFVLFMVIWAIVNAATKGWDPYPFILLNLFLSMLAGLQGAILLIAAKRQDAIAAALSKHDYETNLAAKRDIESLIEMNNRQLVMITDLQEILRRLDPAAKTG
ncbi:MAG: hypothetical protein JWO18_1935 [Microbacteriaceae bacterium]|jgi:uncharacterized membrane protein|nr:hypothetical protein [Microbacteriaceae bacterium]